MKTKDRSKSGSKRKVPATISIERNYDSGGGAFTACVRIGKGASRTDDACEDGSNPRIAMARALRASGELVDERAGTFERYSKRKRRR